MSVPEESLLYLPREIKSPFPHYSQVPGSGMRKSEGAPPRIMNDRSATTSPGSSPGRTER